MTKEEIAENNLLIATFMGWGYDNRFSMQGDIPVWTNKESKNAILSCDFNYNSNWNLLMLVVEKIGNVRIVETQWFNVEITNGFTRINGTGEKITYNASVEKSMIKATWLAVIQFIKWYNDKLKK